VALVAYHSSIRIHNASWLTIIERFKPLNQ
jgi:hypothetical protein